MPGNTATFGGFTATDFYDFTGVNYSSYAVAGYDFLGDITIKKNAPFVTVYLKQTENGFTGNALTGYTPIRESSCQVSAYWDFATDATTTQEAYRLKFPVVVNPDNLNAFVYPTTVITSRLKVRGRGRSLRLRFLSDSGKDMHLYGFDVIGARNPAP